METTSRGWHSTPRHVVSMSATCCYNVSGRDVSAICHQMRTYMSAFLPVRRAGTNGTFVYLGEPPAGASPSDPRASLHLYSLLRTAHLPHASNNRRHSSLQFPCPHRIKQYTHLGAKAVMQTRVKFAALGRSSTIESIYEEDLNIYIVNFSYCSVFCLLRWSLEQEFLIHAV